LRYSTDEKAGIGLVLVVIIIAVILILVVLALPTLYIQKVEARITLSDNDGVPYISDYEFKQRDFTYWDWALHEREKLEVVAPRYKLEFSICDSPPSTDCDKDQANFNWDGNKLTISLTAPTFIGNREFTIRLTDVNADLVIEEIIEWHRF
jgi:hypothetical protein